MILLGGIITGLLVFYGPIAVANVVMVVLTGSRLPQLIRTWFNRATAKATAVSVSSLVVSLASMSFWMAFAILTQNALVVVTTCVAIAIALSTAMIENNIAKRAVAV